MSAYIDVHRMGPDVRYLYYYHPIALPGEIGEWVGGVEAPLLVDVAGIHVQLGLQLLGVASTLVALAGQSHVGGANRGEAQRWMARKAALAVELIEEAAR